MKNNRRIRIMTGDGTAIMPILFFPDRRQTAQGRPFPDDRQGIRRCSARIFCRAAYIVLAVLLLPVLLPASLQAREDNARLVLQKTAGSVKSRVHVVKPGEWIASIIRSQFGDEPVPFALIRRLNPGIRNLNLIHPGQRIILPFSSASEFTGSTPVNRQESAAQPVIYRIQEGDSISRIILSELNLRSAEVLPAYRLIRKLNPEIPDLNRLQAGRTLRLPPAALLPLTASPQTASIQTEKPRPETDVGMSTNKQTPLGIIQQVIHRMRGTVTASGNYFIPLQETTRITIDCSQIPVVELDDGTTVLLDYGNRLSENLKGLIHHSWKNYAFLMADELLNVINCLHGIIRHSPNYRMVRADQPLTLTVKPEIIAFPDWVIRGKETAGTSYLQGLFLLERDERPLPADARVFLEKSGVAVTEIIGDRTVSSLETPVRSQPITTDLHNLKGIALAEQLLALLGETPVRNTEVVVFDRARNGFNLSITADLLLRKGEKRIILHTKKLPDQFIQVLRETGTEVLPIGEKEQGRTLIEGVFQGLGIPVSFGYFTFRIPEDGKRPRLTASFSALRAMNEGESIYLIDFDLPPAGLPFLNGRRGGRVIRY
jgi:hypothetical protein